MGKFPLWKRVKSLGDNLVNRQEQAWLNRENPNIYQVFSDVMKSKRLWVSVDRYGIMRPTKLKENAEGPIGLGAGKCFVQRSTQESGPELPPPPPTGAEETEEEQQAREESEDKAHRDAGVVFKGEYATKNHWLHWDLNPFHGGTSAAGYAPRDIPFDALAQNYGGIRVQGVLNLSDNPEERGGFQCVPRFHGARYFQWIEENRESYGTRPDVAKRNFTEVPEEDLMREEILRVPMKAGSLLVWNSQLPHANFPNTSDEFRMVQYIKMIPEEDPREFQPVMWMDKFKTSEWFPEGFTPSELGRKLLGLEPWDEPFSEVISDSCPGYGKDQRVGRWGKTRKQSEPFPDLLKRLPLILGSSSINRQQILQEAGWPFTVMAADIDEKAIRHDDPNIMTVMIAEAKAEALLPHILEPCILVTSDQVTVSSANGQEEVREKPETAEKAKRYLGSYSNSSVKTICGLVVINTETGKRVTGVDIAEVFWKEIPEEVMDKVIDRGEIMSSAGGFRIEDEDLRPLVFKINGTEQSIKGLPLHTLIDLVQQVDEK